MEEKMKNLKILETRQGFHFPHDVVHDILSKVSAKSLIRFKCVCKLWFTTISESTFEEIHLQQQMSKIMIINHVDNSKTYCVEEEGIIPGKHVVGLKSNNLLLYEDSLLNCKRLYVYDTFTQRHKLLPCITFRHGCSFVYDASTQIYKVVVFRDEFYGSTSNTRRLTCCIYSLDYERWLEDEEWRQLKAPVSQILVSCTSPKFLKGILYWLSRRSAVTNGLDVAFIQPLEIATEKYQEIIKLPYLNYSLHGFNNINLSEIKGLLCLMNPASVFEFDIWVLKDSFRSLWIKLHTISLVTMVDRPSWLGNFHGEEFSPCLVLEGCNNKLTYILFQSYGRELHWHKIDHRRIDMA
ncbi:F-box protein At3g07870-like [Pistacia vera]|uniref:F-box protein At3g07870-like n=1 Tax=Pistacia vera TaxID=55513 RepID=UPI001263D916|nr:F-box protein At3g07870-like [Pistacia vera]XP_031281280.1 F-box protein At3g07870-like [Pistacia vera]